MKRPLTAPGLLALALLLGSAPTAVAADRASVASDLVVPAGSDAVSGRVYLASQDPQGLEAYATSVSDPTSRDYGRYLSASQALARFGASTQAGNEVSAWLAADNLRVAARTRNYLTFSGSASAVNAAFDVSSHNASAPVAVAHDILAVTGLDGDPTPTISTGVNPTNAPPEPVFRNAGPFSDYYGQNVATSLPAAYGSKQPYPVRGYVGQQLRSVYGATPAMTGAGVKVAVITAYASPTLLSDLSTYAGRNGDAPYRPGQVKQVTPSTYTSQDVCDPGGQFGEQTLDTEAVHAIAPAADLTVVSSASCHSQDFYDSVATVVDNHLADVVSNSWYAVDPVTPAQRSTVDNLLQLGATEGIGFYAAAGDNGDLGDFRLDGTHSGEVDFPASDPWVTSVGGTTIAIGAGNRYLWETGWGSHSAALGADGKSWQSPPGDFINGTGGGVIPDTPQPSYQHGIAPGSNRVTPDIAAVGDPTTGFVTGDTQLFPDGTAQYNEHRIGGTSLSTPVIAGIQALAQQITGRPLGFANPLIYQKYRAKLFRDPVGNQTPAQVRVDYVNSFDASKGLVTTLRTSGLDTSLTTAVGYDTTTGVGTPSAAYLASFHR